MRVPFVNCRQFRVISFGFEGRIWDLISVPDAYLFTSERDTAVKDSSHKEWKRSQSALLSFHLRL